MSMNTNRDDLVSQIQRYPWRGRPCGDRKICFSFVERVRHGTDDSNVVEEAREAFLRIRTRHGKNGDPGLAEHLPAEASSLALRAVTRPDLDVLVGLVSDLESVCHGVHALLRRLVVVEADATTSRPTETTRSGAHEGSHAIAPVDANDAASVTASPPCGTEDVEPPGTSQPGGCPSSSSDASSLDASADPDSGRLANRDAERIVASMLERFQAEDLEAMPLPRLRPFCEAVLADCRHWAERLPRESYLVYELDRVVRRVAAVVRTRRPGFVSGLRLGQTLDWERIARDAHARVATFDAEAAVGISGVSRDHVASRARTRTRERGRGEARLASVAAPPKAIVAIVGGDFSPPALDRLAPHAPFELEWSPGYVTGARSNQRLCERINSGSVVGVVMVRKLLSHSASDDIYLAARAKGVPVAQVWTPGTGQLHVALEELERRLRAA